MATYVTKPMEIEAIQFNGNWEEVMKFGSSFPAEFRMMPAEDFYMIAPEGIVAVIWDYLQETWVGVRHTDYIIHGMRGEYYPCDREVFETKYKLKNV